MNNALATSQAFSPVLRSLPSASARALFLAFVDIDDFGQTNERLGVIEADRLLQEITATMETALGARGYVMRVESDEFLLVLDCASPREAHTLAESVRVAVRNRSDRPERDVTISIGLACSRPRESQRSLLMRAQIALCRAKAAGKDQVAFVEHSSVEGLFAVAGQ